MDNRVYLQPAYILHKQPFQNSSLLLDFFCLDFGRVKAVARGARRSRSKYRSLLQVFQPLLVSFTGKGEVKTLASVESSLAAIDLKGERLFSGLYVNELIIRLLMNNVEHTELYKRYQDALVALAGDEEINRVLRRFEISLLNELGYGINLDQDCVSQQPIISNGTYLFIPDLGFEQVEIGSDTGDAVDNVYRGEHIKALRDLDFDDPASRAAAKKITRQALRSHLGNKPLNSRGLFVRRS